MSKKTKKKTWQQKVGITLSLIGIIAMIFFTIIPFFMGGGRY